jgi:hypothetical protein
MPNLCIEMTDHCGLKANQSCTETLLLTGRHKSIATLFGNNLGEEEKLRAKYTHILPSFQGAVQDSSGRTPAGNEKNADKLTI